MKSLDEQFNQVFDVRLSKVDEKMLLNLICLNNYYSTRGGDAFVIPKTMNGLKEKVLNALIEKSDRERIRKKVKNLLSM